MNDLDQQLRHAGARLRDTAPSPAATEAALATVGDVQLDHHASARRRLWIVAPAVLAAAAAIVGLIVMTRPDQQAVVPAETTVLPAPATTVVSPPSVGPTTVPTTVTTVPPTTSPIAPGTDLGFGVSLETSNEDFDGDGGACLTLSTPTDVASGCASGATMRTADGSPLSLRLDGTSYVLFPLGVDANGGPSLFEEGTSACFAGADLPGALVEDAGCAGDGRAVLGVLPAAPDGSTTWTLVGADVPPASAALELLTASDELGARAFRSPAADGSGTCVIVATRNNSVREACGIPGTNQYLAGTADAPLVVTSDSEAGTATLDPLDPGTALATNDCANLTAGELAALLPEHGMAGSLICGADMGAVWVSPELVDPRFAETAWDVLRRGDDGTWTVAASEVDYTCTQGVAAEVCAELEISDFGQAPPFPSVASIAGFDEAVGDGTPLPGRPAIEELPSVAPAADLAALADAVVTELRAAAEDPDQRFEVFSDSAPIVIRRTNLDDSVTATIFVLAVGPFEDGFVVFANGTRAVDICGRGTTTLDGATVCV